LYLKGDLQDPLSEGNPSWYILKIYGGKTKKKKLFFLCPQPGSFSLVLDPEEERPVAGLGIRKDDEIAVKSDCNRGKTDNMNIKDLEPGLDIDKLLIMGLYVIA
jgi:hypothetical protein